MHTTTEKIKFLTACFGKNYRLSKNGSNVAFECPACGKNSQKLKFSICLESWMCHCWVCGLKGKSPYHVIKRYISIDKAEIFKAKFKLKEKTTTTEDVDIVKFPTKFNLFAQQRNIYDPDVKDMIKYLRKRGVTYEDMWRNKIGYFTGNRWSRRVVFPSFDNDQNLNFYVTRAIDDDAFLKYKKNYKCQYQAQMKQE